MHVFRQLPRHPRQRRFPFDSMRCVSAAPLTSLNCVEEINIQVEIQPVFLCSCKIRPSHLPIRRPPVVVISFLPSDANSMAALDKSLLETRVLPSFLIFHSDWFGQLRAGVGAGEDPVSNTESLWLGRQRGLFARCQALGVSGSAIKRSPHLLRCFRGCRWFSNASLRSYRLFSQRTPTLSTSIANATISPHVLNQ
jgi:hypothetical protein